MLLKPSWTCVTLLTVSLTGIKSQNDLGNNQIEALIDNIDKATYNIDKATYNQVDNFIDSQIGVDDLTGIESEIEREIVILEKFVTEKNEGGNNKIYRDLLIRVVGLSLLGLYRHNGLELDDDGEDTSNMRLFRQVGHALDDFIGEEEDGIEESLDFVSEKEDKVKGRLFQNGHVPQFPGEPLRTTTKAYLTQLVGRALNAASFAAGGALNLKSKTTSPCGKHTWRGLLPQFSFLRQPWTSYFGSAEHDYYSSQFISRIKQDLGCLLNPGNLQYAYQLEARKAQIRLKSLLDQYKILIDGNLKQYEIRQSDSSSLDGLVNREMLQLYDAVDAAKNALEEDREKRQSVFGQLLMHKLNGWTLLTLGRNMATYPSDDVGFFDVPLTHWYQLFGNALIYTRSSQSDFERLIENYRTDFSNPACGNGPLWNVLDKYSYLLYGVKDDRISLNMKRMEMEMRLALACLLNQENSDISTLKGAGKSSALGYRIDEFVSAVQIRLDNS